MTESTSNSAVLSDGRPVTDDETSHLPGDTHMWVMVLGDLVIFGAYFLIYMVHRAMAPEAFLVRTTAPRRHHRRGQHDGPADQFAVRRAQCLCGT